jgi:hypothetical protein
MLPPPSNRSSKTIGSINKSSKVLASFARTKSVSSNHNYNKLYRKKCFQIGMIKIKKIS